MLDILYVTGNKDKYADGEKILAGYGFRCQQKVLKLSELQETEGELIALDKARQAFEILRQPLFVNDTVWLIPALNNFPGAFMKYVNDCFTPEDWLRLMNGVKDRRAIMREILVYNNGITEKLFYRDIIGDFLNEFQGNDGVSSDKVISFSGDGISIARHRDSGSISTASKQGKTSYDLLGEWLQKNHKQRVDYES